jgi:SAM-dependent methyltransferase
VPLTEHVIRVRKRARLKVLAIKGRLGMTRHVFADIHKFNLWGDHESRSGRGSSLASTEAVRRELPLILRQFRIRTMLDGGCGDCNWISRMDLGLELYVGVEIVPALVEANRRRNWKGACDRKFMTLDIARDPLPCVDLVFCRHCLIHLPLRDISACVENFRASGSKFLMTTTVPGCPVNRDVLAGGFREINLEAAPFFFPPPLARLNDIVLIDGEYRSNGWLYLWRIADLPLLKQ